MVWVTWPARNIGEAPPGGNSVKAKHASGAALSKHGSSTFVFRDGMVWSAVMSHADTILRVCVQQCIKVLHHESVHMRATAQHKWHTEAVFGTKLPWSPVQWAGSFAPVAFVSAGVVVAGHCVRGLPPAWRAGAPGQGTAQISRRTEAAGCVAAQHDALCRHSRRFCTRRIRRTVTHASMHAAACIIHDASTSNCW